MWHAVEDSHLGKTSQILKTTYSLLPRYKNESSSWNEICSAILLPHKLIFFFVIHLNKQANFCHKQKKKKKKEIT